MYVCIYVLNACAFFTAVSAKRTEADWRLSVCCQLIAKLKAKKCFLIYSMPSLVIFIFYTWELHCQHIPISWSKTTRICVGLSYAVFKICGQRSVSVSYIHQSEVHCMHAVCNLQSAVCSLQMSDTGEFSVQCLLGSHGYNQRQLYTS